MASNHSTGKNTSGPNQPLSREVKDSVSKKPLEFPTFDPSRRYSSHIPSQSTPDLTYTSSLETPNPNQDPSLNEEIHRVTPEEPVYRIPNKKVDQLHRHTHAYLQSIGQIPIIYQIPRSRTSHRRTKPYSENEIIASSIDDLIINTISDIRQSIETIAHSETKKDPELQNLLNFPEADSSFYNFPKAKAGGFGPLEPLETNRPCTNPPSSRLSFNFVANMAANKLWLDADAIAVPDAQHTLPKHLEKFLPKFDSDNDVTPEDHIKQFMLSLRLMDVQHEDVVCRLFPYTLVGKASTWFFSLTMGFIASW